MFRLTVLGSPALADGNGAEIRSVLAQPKRLALLAYLAVEGARGFVRRDTLLALFWPDSDVESARQALRQTLYHLRRATAEDVFVARSADELSVNRDALWCDAVAFDAHLKERRHAEAMGLYRGDFLPAFAFANQSVEFEQWLESTRGALRSRAASAAATLRDDAARAAQHDAAATWARVAAQLSPDDERVARRLIEVLDAGGDRAGALRAYDEFSRRLWTTFETKPSAETTALVDTVRARTKPGGVPLRAAPPATGESTGGIAAGGMGLAADRAAPPDAPVAASADTDSSSDGPRGAIRVPLGPVASGGRRPIRALWGAALVAGLVGVAGAVWLITPHTGASASSTASAPTLAVLPFTHEGPATDSYLANGITEDIRGRLAGLPGLRVIAAASSDQYPIATGGGVQRIGRELGAEYILTGRVDRAQPNDSTHVRVTPELIRVSDATTAWSHPFDAAPTRIVDVQSQVAQAVVRALHVAVTDSARAALARLPTGNSEAYDAYLRGSELFASGPADAVVLRKAVAELERAVALDTLYADAWAELGVARTRLYEDEGSPQRSDIERARVAIDRALALDSTLPNAWAALGGYYGVAQGDEGRSLQALRTGLRFSPRDPAILTLIALNERGAGQWNGALGHFEEARSIDPRNLVVLYDLGMTLFWLHRFSEAQEIANQMMAIDRDAQGWEFFGMIQLGQGNLGAARALMTRAAQIMDPTSLVTYVSTYGDLYWMLDDRQRALLLRLTPVSFGDDRMNWSFALAGGAWVAGDSVALRAYADSARRASEANVRTDPSDCQNHSLLARANAWLGHRDVAVREAQRGVAMCPRDKDPIVYAYVMQTLAQVYTLVGDGDRAVATLAQLQRVPSFISSGWLRVDPTFAPLRGRPDFQRLMDAP